MAAKTSPLFTTRNVGDSPATVGNIEHLLAQFTHLPVGRAARLLPLGKTHARTALGYLGYWLRSGFLDESEKHRQLNELHLTAALRTVNCMGYLRGSLLKVGQMLANVPNIVPDEFAEIFAKLNCEAPPMHYSLLREFVRRELGDDPENLFAEFDRRAFAAASLGQVHRARLKTGETVAVKIQYPGIARTIRDDFKNLNLLLTPLRLHEDWQDLRAQILDGFDMLTLETDYRREARLLEQARGLFRPDDGIVVPRVYPDYSTERILTMEYLDGRHLDAYLATVPPRTEIDRYGERITRAMMRLSSVARVCYADPHPGNYLFLEDGRLGLLDFGCCREYSPEEWDYVCLMQRAIKHRPEELDRALRQSGKMTGRHPRHAEVMGLFERYVNWVWEPVKVDGPFDFRDGDYLKRGVDLLTEVIRTGYVRSQPVNNWINRGFLGLRSVLHRLGACFDFRRVEDEEDRPMELWSQSFN